jgi:hypothetical protein
MTSDNHVFRGYFDSVISNDIQQDIVRCVFKGYVEADKFVNHREYQPGPAKNCYPYIRWIEIDDNCLALNKKYPGLQTSSEQNIIRNSFHTLVSLGNVRITISAVATPSSLPRTAVFRNNLASCQYRFDISADQKWFELRDLESVKDRIVYAFVIHGPMLDNPRFPGFIHIAFPDESCTRYLDRINLLKRFPDLIEELQREDMIQIPDKAEVKLNVPEEKLL